MARLFNRSKPEVDVEPDEEPTELESIRILTAEAELPGWVGPLRERVTDLLQRGDSLSFLPSGAANEPENWVTFEPNELLLVVPPPWTSPPEWRLPRRQCEVNVRTGPYHVTGVAHLPPGAEHDLFSRIARPFLPLTNVTMLRAGEPEGAAEHLDVVIVNLRQTDEYRVV